MTYAASEQSKHGGKPIELFRYVGTYQNFYYTSGQMPIEYQAPDELAPNTYVPLNTRRSAVGQMTQNDDNSEVTIEMPVSTDIVAIYGFQISPPDLELTIFRGHNPGEYVRYWSGKVENIQVVKGTATIRVPSELAAALGADFPNVYYQGPCNHSLFDERCGVPFEDWSASTLITAINGKTLTLAEMPLALDGQLVGGDCLLPSGERRMIVAQTANTIMVNYPFAGAELGGEVMLAAGCDLAWKGDCKVKFNNTARFGGMPLIPPLNIFSSGIEPGQDVADAACIPDIYTGIYWSIEIRIAGTALAAPAMNVFGPPANRNIRPNPGGRVIRPSTQSYAGLTTFLRSIYELNTADPYDGLNGQPLEIGHRLSNTHFRRDFYYPFKPSGNWRVQIQSNVTHKLTPSPTDIFITLYDQSRTARIGRLWPYDYYFTT